MALTVSYVLSAIATVLGICEPFNKKMAAVLVFNLAGNMLVGVSYLLAGGAGALSGAIICFVACIQVFINFWFARYDKKVPRIMLVIYLISFVGVNLAIFKAWYDVFALGAAICYVFSISQHRPGTYRILYCANSMLWITYDIMASTYGNLSTHIALAVFTLISMYVNDRKSVTCKK